MDGVIAITILSRRRNFLRKKKERERERKKRKTRKILDFHPSEQKWRRSAPDALTPYLFPSKISFPVKYSLYTQRYVHSPYDFSLKCLS